MPIYEYQCGACGEKSEKLQKMNDLPLRDCPVCGAAELNKLISAAVFRLKGAGWYETDFKTGNKKNVSGGEDKSDSSTDSGKSDTSSDSGSSTQKDDSRSISSSAN